MHAIIKNQYNKKHPQKCSGGDFFIKNETEIKEIFFDPHNSEERNHSGGWNWTAKCQ